VPDFPRAARWDSSTVLLQLAGLLVDWSIRETGPEAVAIWLDVAEELLP
jgi:hypothetical protein